jgi:hypothetical protein
MLPTPLYSTAFIPPFFSSAHQKTWRGQLLLHDAKSPSVKPSLYKIPIHPLKHPPQLNIRTP